MPLKKSFIALLFLLVTAPAFGAPGDGVEARVTELEGRVGTLEVEASQQQVKIDQNAADIAQNAADIADNAADIADNAADIAQNTSDILQNASDIADNADDIAKNAADIYVLQQNGGGGGGGGPAWAVVDSDGYDVGTVVSIGTTLEAVVEIAEPGYDPYLVTITRPEISTFNFPLYFADAGCSPAGGVFTTVYINTLTDVAIFVEPGFPDSRVAYLVNHTPTPASISSVSVSGGCSGYSDSFDALPVTPVSGTDLHGAYPPPYRLESLP